MTRLSATCPCGSSSDYASCCRTFHAGLWPPSPLLLMRARYTAYAVGDARFVYRTWHPRTRPDEVVLDPDLRWVGLTIRDHGDDWVSFEASYLSPGGAGVLAEHSRFEQRASRWMYVDGDT